MDEAKTQSHGLEDENAFAQTLIPDVNSTDIQQSRQAAKPSDKTKSSTRQPPWVGKIMGHFKLLRLIGEGAMGLVIQAEDTHLKRIVALKVLRKSISAGDKGKTKIDQFLREARAAAAIEHPNIVRVYEINQHEGWWYIAMEMVGENSLQDIVRAVGALPPSRACPIIADAAIGLQVAHEMGMIHRDIKPSNILVTRNGHGKVSDFGLVRVEDPNDPVDTFAHQSIGTPFYMAPEIIRRQTISSAVDIYSLGATLYYTLTGRPPFNAEKMEDVFKQHLHAEPPVLSDYFPDCSENLSSLITKMMAKEPAIRPSAAEVAAALHAESISFLPDNPVSVGPGGSTVSTDWQAPLQKTRTVLQGWTTQTHTPPLTKLLGQLNQRRKWTIAALLIVFISVFVLIIYNRSSQPKQDRRTVVRLFPNAALSYGTRDAGFIPKASSPSQTPAFSWKGKVDTSGIRFIASRSGRFFYAIHDPRAILIPADLFVGYKTMQDAFKDDKEAAP